MARFRPFWMKTSPSLRMIDWLAGKRPDDWFYVSCWMHDPAVHDWILSHPQCDRGIAARIFWTLFPEGFAERLARGETPTEAHWPTLQRILRDWRAGRWTRAGLAFTPDKDELTRYRRLCGRLKRIDPLDIPEGLFQPQPGRAPEPSPQTRTDREPLNFLLFELGTVPGGMDLVRFRAWRMRVDQWRAFQMLAFFAVLFTLLSLIVGRPPG